MTQNTYYNIYIMEDSVETNKKNKVSMKSYYSETAKEHIYYAIFCIRKKGYP